LRLFESGADEGIDHLPLQEGVDGENRQARKAGCRH